MSARLSPQNIAVIRRVLAQEGFSPVAIAASMARFSAESKFDPRAINRGDGADGSDSIGINQWNAGRARALKAFANEPGQNGDPFSVETQARFFAKEVRGSEAKNGGTDLLNASTPQEAVNAVLGMVRPGGYSKANPAGSLGYKETLGLAKQFASGDYTYRGYNGKTLTGAQAGSYLPPDDRGLMQGSKSRGRTAEEGDVPMTVPDLTGFGESLNQPSPAQAEIDNSPGGQIKQGIMGLLGVAAKFQEDSAKKDRGGNIFSQRQMTQDLGESPSAHSIVAMIQRMGL